MTISSFQLTRRRLLYLTAAGSVASLAGCAGDQLAPATDEEAKSKTVAVGPDGNFVFTPGTEDPLRIVPGTTVRFVWESDTHNIFVDSQPQGANWQGHESIENTGFTYKYTFEVEGTYHYWCEPHKGLGMIADIIVE